MSIDKTLASKLGQNKTRNVLTRVERIQQLTREGRFTEGESSTYGLPKVRVLKIKRGKKKKKSKDEDK